MFLRNNMPDAQKLSVKLLDAPGTFHEAYWVWQTGVCDPLAVSICSAQMIIERPTLKVSNFLRHLNSQVDRRIAVSAPGGPSRTS